MERESRGKKSTYLSRDVVVSRWVGEKKLEAIVWKSRNFHTLIKDNGNVPHTQPFILMVSESQLWRNSAHSRPPTFAPGDPKSQATLKLKIVKNKLTRDRGFWCSLLFDVKFFKFRTPPPSLFII